MHHGVRITDPAVIAAATLSHRYIADRHLPDKAIDLIDEAGARLRTEIDSKPQALDEVDRQGLQLEIEREALKKEKDKASRERLERIEKELADLQEQSSQLHTRWQTEKDAISGLRQIKEQIDQARVEIERAERQNQLESRRPPALRHAARARSKAGGERKAPQGLAARRRPAQGGGRPRGDRAGRRALDRHPRLAPAGGRDGKAGAHGRAPAPARGRAGRRPARRFQRRAPFACRLAGPQPPYRLIHLYRSHRRGQDRAGRAPWRSSSSTTSAPWCAST